MVSDLLNTFKFEGLEILQPSTSNTDTATFISIKDVSKIMAWIHRSAAAATADKLDVLTLLQATDTSGTSAKTLGAGIAATELDDRNAVVEDAYALEANVGQFDTENDFFFVGLRCALVADAGTNTVEVVWLSDPNVSQRGHSTTQASWSNKDAA